MSETNLETKSKSGILKRGFYYFIKVQIFFMLLFIFLQIVLKNEIKNLLNFSIENQKLTKKKLKSQEISSYNYSTLVILSAIPITSYFAIDRFYIGNKFAPVKLIVNLLTFGIGHFIWWIIDLIKVLNCTMEDKDGKIVCNTHKK